MTAGAIVTIEDFLGLLMGDAFGKQGTLVLSHALRNADGEIPKENWHDLPLDLSRITPTRVAQIARRYSRREEVYFGCAVFAGERRLEAQAIAYWFLYADLDAGVIPDGLPPATVVLLTSPGRRHAFWKLDAPLDRATAVDLNRRIAHACGADLSGVDATQVLRLPTMTNHKYADKPMVAVEEWEPGNVSTPAGFALLPLPPASTRGTASLIGMNGHREKVGEGQRHNYLKGVAARLRNTGISDATLKVALMEESQQVCDPPSPEEEVEGIVAWITGKEAHVPALSPPVPQQHGHAASALTLTPADQITPRRTDWFWPGRIPYRKVTLIEGDPGVGKGNITIDLAARASKGEAMPDGTRGNIAGPITVILVSTAEDDAEDTIVPRLIEAGADLSRVHVAQEDATDDLYSLADIPALERKIVATGALLVVVDPVTAYLPDDVETNDDKGIRKHVLRPLRGVAARTGAAIVPVRHLNKSGGKAAIYRGAGTIGFAGAARSVLLAARDQTDTERHVLAVTKSNAAAIAPAMAYALVRGETWDVSRVVWKGTTEDTSDALLTPPPDPEELSALEVAMDFLKAALADGRVKTADIAREARAQSISDRTLTRARARLGVQARRDGFGEEGSWYLSLPEAPTPPPPDTEALTAEQRADWDWSERILAANWEPEALGADDFVRLSGRGYPVTQTMSLRRAARAVRERLNGH
jgi:putative DNA primase/helicase